MAKRKAKEIEVIEPITVNKPSKKYLMKANVGTNPDGSVKFPKGSLQELSKKQIDNYKLNNII